MNLFVDGSGVAVFDRDTGLQAAVFKEHNGRLDGRAEARRYVGSRLVVEAAAELIRAVAAEAAGGADAPRDTFDAAMILFQSLQDSGVATDDATQLALAALHARARSARPPAQPPAAEPPGPGAQGTDTPATPPARPAKKPR